MRFFSLLAQALTLLVALAACGGGGGSPGTVPGSTTPGGGGATLDLRSTAPSALSIQRGAAQSYSISGGVGPYTAVSSNVSVASSGVSGSEFVIGGVAVGTTSVTLRDAREGLVTVNVTVTVPPLFTTAPGSVILAVNASASFGVGGGAAPYTVSSNNLAVASASIAGNTLTVNGVGAGSAQLQVRDDTGLIVTIGVTVTALPALAVTAPATVTLDIGGASAQTYSVTGGVAPYTAVSSNVNVATAQLAGSSLTVTGISSGTANIVVFDSAGASKQISVTVTATAAASLFTTAPSSVTTQAGVSTDYGVGGGSPGYTATSSNTAVATVSLVGNTLTVTGVGAGSANVEIRDAANTTITVSVTVPAPVALFTSAPVSITVSIGSAPSYTISGGVGPYLVTSSAPSVATVSLTGSSFTVTGVASGTASVRVTDSLGALVTIDVTVPPPSLLGLFTTAPSSLIVATGSTPAFSIGGGTAPYVATSSNVAVAGASVAGSTLTLDGVANGTALVLVTDAVGQSLSINVTVSNGQLSVSPSSATAIVGDTVVATLSGGTAPFTVSVSNTAVATASVAGTTLTIQVNQGTTDRSSASITVTDARGLQTVFELTAVPAQPSIQLSPVTLTISELSTDPITLTAFGASGSIAAFSSDLSLLNAAVAGNTITVTTGTAGNRCVAGDLAVTISAVDSVGALATTVITIANSQAACP